MDVRDALRNGLQTASAVRESTLLVTAEVQCFGSSVGRNSRIGKGCCARRKGRVSEEYGTDLLEASQES
jgi:hypothetical protein